MESDDAEEERVQSRCALWIQQLHVLLWKDIYLKRICRHYPSLLIEITLMIVLLLGIQEETVVREPLILRGDTIYPPVHPSHFWNTNPALANIREVYYFAEDNSYLHKLTVEAFADLGVSNVVSLSSEAQLIAIARDVVRQTMPVRTVVLRYSSTSDTAPESLHVSFFAGPLPFDVQLHYQRRLIASPEGPAREEMYPEVNTLLPIVAALQQRHLQLQAGRFNYNHPLHPVTLRRFPYPDHIEYHDTKNYAFVLTRFCVGMLIPFSMFAAHLAEEKATGIKEMQRLVGLSDWVYWASHYLAGLAIHTCISTIMMLFLCILRNEQGRAFIEYSDPALLLWILMCFCSSCIMHATLLSMFFSTSASAVAGAMVYWTICCLLPFLALEHADGQGYHYIQRKHKLWTAIFPGMNLHWSFRILERFEKFVDHGANWNNFFDSAATPDNVTLGEMILLGISTEWAIMFLVWYIDNVFPTGPTIAKSFFYFLKVRYWFPAVTIVSSSVQPEKEPQNFEPEPNDRDVEIELVQTSKSYDGVMAVTDLSLRVYKNQITVLLGHNGAGKTTLLKMITGFLDCTSGLVLVRGYDIKTCTRNARESIGYCPQNNILYDDLTVEENLMVFALIKGIRRDKVRQVVFTLLNDVGLWYCRTAIAPQLSPGQQRSLCAAIAILGRPKVIIMDEPTAYMDPHSRREMWELLLTIRRSCTILLTTQNLDEADVLGDRIAIMINGRIRCIGSTTFLKQQFGTGYHMRINKMDGCKVTLIEKVLRKYAPKAALQSDSDREAVFVLGQIATTQNIIMMFTELENKTKVLRIHSMGLAVTSLEDVVILVGEDQPTYGRHERPAAGGDEQQVQVGVHESQLKVVTSATANQPSSAAVVRALLKKRAIHAWRERRMPLFIWVIPPLLLTLLFVLENFATRGTGNEVERTGDTLRYSFPDVFIFATGFVQADTQDSILKNYLEPMFTNDFDILRVPKEDDINTYLLEYAGDSLRKFVFDLHFGVQMTTNGTVLWFNGQIQHSAVLATTLFNNARLRNVTNVGDATFSFDVSTFGLEALPQLDSWNRYSSHNKYYQVLPEVLRSIFFPLCSSLMCCAFVLFPIAERAMQVKHLHMITGVSPLLYWLTNFVFDFSFYLGTALLVLPPVVYFQYDVLTPSDIKLIFALNCLHGYAALPVIYVFSFMFNNPGVGFSTLAVWTFIISAIGCFASVFVDHYSHGESSPHLVIAIRMLLQALRMVPSTSYSRGMIKVLQLAHENAVCWKGGTELEASCRGEANQHRLSLMQCCRYLKSGDADQHAIHPLDMHSYSALSEVLSLSFEGALMFGVLLFVEWYIPRFKMCMSMLEPSAYLQGVQVPTSTQAAPHSLPRPMKGDVEDTDVARENEIVAGLVAGRLVPDTAHPYLLVNRLFKSYGYINSNPVLQGLSFTVQKGECFGLLGVNGVGKTTTFRILTGELLPHEGDAYITGVSLVQTPRQFRRYIGYCPEKDGVLDVLTGKETVLLFGRLRGLAMTPEYTNVLLDIFNLTEIANQLVRTYSGNRRTLSLCIAVLGVPRLLLLDEPYVGIGSSARKRIINFISAIQKATEASIVLSSHSMADVEFLCNRIAILSDGQLQCIGSLANLKEKFGKGYTIIVKTYPYRKQDDDYLRDVAEAIVRAFRRAELMQIYEGQLEFHMSRVYLLWSDMFSRMANIKKRYKLQDFFITDTSLEQIFLSVARKEASSADTAAAKANARDAGSPPVALGI